MLCCTTIIAMQQSGDTLKENNKNNCVTILCEWEYKMRKTDYSQGAEVMAKSQEKSDNSHELESKTPAREVIGGYFGNGFAMPPVVIYREQ